MAPAKKLTPGRRWTNCSADIPAAGRRSGHPGRDGLPHQGDLGSGQAAGLVDEAAEGALRGQGFGGEGAGGRAEKLKLGKQKAEIARRPARRLVRPEMRGRCSLATVGAWAKLDT
jgi:hypothetical protein